MLPFDLNNRAEFTQLVDELTRHGLHPTELVRQRYARHFPDTTVLDLHSFSNDREYKIHLFCNVIVDMPNTCEALRNNTMEMKPADGQSNPAFEFGYDMLVMDAFKKGLISAGSTISRDKAFKKAKERQQSLGKSEKDFPLICLPETTLQRLYDLSVTAEKSMYNFTEDGREERHRNGFETYKKKKKFCHVDTEKVLESQEWNSFIRSLR
jgi:hypothetical protein